MNPEWLDLFDLLLACLQPLALLAAIVAFPITTGLLCTVWLAWRVCRGDL